MTKNTESTRYFSDKHEKQVCNLLGATQTPNSGAGLFRKGDAVQEEASMLIECKTVTDEKKSISIKKDWIDKNKEEAFRLRLDNTCIAFNFKPNGESYFVINERLMKYLIERLEEDNE